MATAKHVLKRILMMLAGYLVSVLVGFSTMAVASVVLFRRGRWKRVKV